MKAYRGEPSIFAGRKPQARNAELIVERLTLHFGGITAIRNVDLKVSTGELVCIIGPNGAGKTSLLNSITGFYGPKGTSSSTVRRCRISRRPGTSRGTE